MPLVTFTIIDVLDLSMSSRFLLHRFLQFWVSCQTFVNFYVISHLSKEHPKTIQCYMLSSREREMVLSSHFERSHVHKVCACISCLQNTCDTQNIFLHGLTVLSETLLTLDNLLSSMCLYKLTKYIIVIT